MRQSSLTGPLLVLVFLLSIAVGSLPIIPPPVTDTDDSSVTQAMRHIETIASEPRPIGSAANARAASYIAASLEELGFDVTRQTATVDDYYGSPGSTVEIANVMGRIAGAEPTGAVAMMAHLDTVPMTDGANDNAAAVASLLEAARTVAKGPVPRNDVIFLFTDGEEPRPRYGVHHFLETHPWAEDVSFVVNFEASGGAGSSMVIESSGSEIWAIDRLTSSVNHPVAYSLMTDVTEILGGVGTDFTPFADRGTAGLNFAYLHGSPIYHTASDSLESVSRRSLGHQLSVARELAVELANSDLTMAAAGSSGVYFSVGRGAMIKYSDGLAVPFAAMAMIAVCFVLVLRVRRRASTFRSVASGTMICLGAALALVFVLTLLWLGVAALRPSMSIPESYGYLVVLAAISYLWWHRVQRRGQNARRGAADLAGGLVLIWSLIGLATALTIPGASYVFTWPAFAGVAVLALPSIRLRPWIGWLTYAGTAVVLAGVTVPIIDFVFQMAQPRPGNPDSQMTSVVGGAVFLIFLVVATADSMTRGLGLLAGSPAEESDKYQDYTKARDAVGAAG